jgi:hypothetical protein
MVVRGGANTEPRLVGAAPSCVVVDAIVVYVVVLVLVVLMVEVVVVVVGVVALDLAVVLVTVIGVVICVEVDCFERLLPAALPTSNNRFIHDGLGLLSTGIVVGLVERELVLVIIDDAVVGSIVDVDVLLQIEVIVYTLL